MVAVGQHQVTTSVQAEEGHRSASSNLPLASGMARPAEVAGEVAWAILRRTHGKVGSH